MNLGAARVLVLQLALTGLGYAALSWVAVTLALPWGFASPLFPAAGLALACVLAWGMRMLPAVAIASGSLTMLFNGAPGAATWMDWVVPVSVGLGAAVQAALGAWLVRRFVRAPLELGAPEDILRFMLLAGPVACLVSATVGTLALGVTRSMDPDGLAVTWATWWCGDTLGVLLAAPLLLAFIGQPADAWRPRRWTVAMPLGIVMLMLALAIDQVSQRELLRRDAMVTRDVNAAVDRVKRELQRHVDALEALHGVFLASDEVTRDEFRRAAGPWLERLTGVQALGWHERLHPDAVAAFEAQVQAEGLAGFKVFNRNDGLPPPADDMLVMRFIEPMVSNASALGVNVLTIPAAAAAIDRARRSDHAVASAGFRLTQEAQQQTGVVIYRAVYHGVPRNEAERLPATRGMVFLTLRMDEALRQLAAELPVHLGLCLVDRGPLASTAAPPQQPQRLAGAPGCESDVEAPAMVRWKQAGVDLAGRDWELRVRIDETQLPGATPWTIWVFAMAGLMAATLLSILLLTITGRTRRIESAVRERTAQLQREIAERSSAEVALRESEQRLRNIFNTVPTGIVYTDLQGRIIQVNPGFCQLTGYSTEELTRMATADLTHPADRSADISLLQRMAAGELPSYRRTKRYLTRDGEVRWVRIQVRPLFDAAGRPYRTVGVVEDISEHLKLEEAERARKLAEASNRAKSDFLSRMSHELRTPLNAMLGFAQLLGLEGGKAMTSRQKEWLGQIQTAGWHLLDMINDVLDLSRIDLGTVKLHTEALQVRQLLQDSVALVEAEALQRGVRVELADANLDELAVVGDATRVKQILTNLLSNAVKYNREGGRVAVSARAAERPGHPEGDVVEIAVQDTGMGLSPEQIAHLFEPFNRLGREASGVAGTGIGLVISRRLAEGMGGELRAQSEAGQGSTFTLVLPSAAVARGAVSGWGELGVVEPSYGARRVHYIEDNEINAEVMRGVLAQRPQIDLSISATAAEGMTSIRDRSPDLVLLDMHLPDMDGLEVLARLRGDPRTADVPVVVVSADALQDQIEGALHAGAQRYLTKPVDVREVLSIVDELLGARDARPA
jgi:PAS domain S-box-containing protein